MAFVVVYDACVLYPAHLRDFLIRVAATGLVQAKWSEEIVDEAIGAITRKNPDLASRLNRTRELLLDALPDCLVTGFEPLMADLELPDSGDRHVLAAAIRAHAQVIVTFNARDFPAQTLAPFGIEAQTPDEFASNLIGLDHQRVDSVINELVAALQRPPVSRGELFEILSRDGLKSAVDLLKNSTASNGE